MKKGKCFMSKIKGYMTVKECAKKLNPSVSTRRVQAMLSKGQIEGAVKIGNMWLIPDNFIDPRDLNYRLYEVSV